MAERIEPSPYFEARPSAEFSFPSESDYAGRKWIDAVIDARDLQFQDGVGGAPGYYQGLNEVVYRRVKDVLESPCGNDCRMDVDAGVRLDESGSDFISVELSCGAIRGEHEEEVDDKAARCKEHYEHCQKTLGTWLAATELEIQQRQANITEAQVEIRTQQDRIRDLT